MSTLIQDMIHEIAMLKERLRELERPVEVVSFVSGVDGSVLFIASGAAAEDNAGLFYDNANNRLGIGTNTPSGALDIAETDAGTTNVLAVRAVHRSSGTPAAGFGEAFRLQAHSASNIDRTTGDLEGTWVTATDASRKARVRVLAYDTAAREVMRGEATGTAAAIGFLGAAAVVRQTGGAATAGMLYTATEQGMLQRVYDMARLVGLLT